MVGSGGESRERDEVGAARKLNRDARAQLLSLTCTVCRELPRALYRLRILSLARLHCQLDERTRLLLLLLVAATVAARPPRVSPLSTDQGDEHELAEARETRRAMEGWWQQAR